MNATSSKVKWTKNLEQYFKELGEQSLCLSMLHKESEAVFSRKAQWIDLPVIVLSTLCGSLTLSAKSLFGEANEETALKAVGGLSLFSGVLGTIQAYFSFSRRAENHRNSYLEYAKLYRFVKVELGLPRQQRIQAKDLIKIVNDGFERLNELSPLVPPKILSNFRSKYKKEPLKKPPIVNGLEPITIFVRRDDEEDDQKSEESPQPLRKLRKILDNQPLLRPRRVMSMPNFTPPPVELTSMAGAALAVTNKLRSEKVADDVEDIVSGAATSVVEGAISAAMDSLIDGVIDDDEEQ